MNEIEKKFYEMLMLALSCDAVKYSDNTYSFNECNYSFTVEPQPKHDCFSGYVPDFAFMVNGKERGFVVEIDGHEWHEKTKEQARADKEKDRAYLSNGFIPVRFTGSEVYHNAHRCVNELKDIMVSNYHFFQNDIDEVTIDKYENHILELQDYASDLEKYIAKVTNQYVNPLAILVKDGQVKPRKNAIEIGE